MDIVALYPNCEAENTEKGIKIITLMKEFCAQPLRLLQKKELEKDI